MAIASCLVDTNILLRMTPRSDPQHQLVDTALARLASQGTIFNYTHQNIAELWNAMTRPLVRNGLGLIVAEAEREVRAIESGMTFLPDGEAVYREWRRIVVQHAVLGVQVHDARLAAAMYVHHVSHILTLMWRISTVSVVSPQFIRPLSTTGRHPGSSFPIIDREQRIRTHNLAGRMAAVDRNVRHVAFNCDRQQSSGGTTMVLPARFPEKLKARSAAPTA
jgi:predicted nucleic acid-binding protein